jgi:hypothetical protein
MSVLGSACLHFCWGAMLAWLPKRQMFLDFAVSFCYLCCCCCHCCCNPAVMSQVRLALAGKGPLNAECYQHPGRKGCKVERLLAEV